GLADIERDAALVAAMDAPPDGSAIPLHSPTADRVAPGWLHLDDIGTEVGKDSRAEGRGNKVPELEDTQAAEQRLNGTGHVYSFPVAECVTARQRARDE